MFMNLPIHNTSHNSKFKLSYGRNDSTTIVYAMFQISVHQQMKIQSK